MKNKVSYFLNFIIKPFSTKEKNDFFYFIDGSLIFLLPSIILLNFFLITSKFNYFDLKANTNFLFFLYIVVIAPLFEELIFRLSLIKTTLNLILSALSCLLYVFIRFYYFDKLSTIDYILVSLSFYFVLLIYIPNNSLLIINFYFFNFLFAFLHIFNNILSFKFIHIYFFMIFNYLILSLIFSYYRIYKSFKVNLLMHASYNLLSLIPILVKS